LKLFNTHTHNLSSEELGIKQLALFEIAPDFYFSTGIHPMNVNQEKFDVTNPLFEHPNCKAVGEIGLDNRFPNLLLQEEIYIRQLQLAEKLKKPILLHTVNTSERCVHLHQNHAPNSALIYHGFNKAKQTAQLLKYEQIYFSIGANVLTNLALREALKLIPLDKLLLETDDSNCDLAEIYETVAKIKSVNLPDFTERIFQNAQRIFKI
jgi:TatD DNase family protein